MIGRVDVKTLLKFYSALQCGLMDIRPGHFQEKLGKNPKGSLGQDVNGYQF